MAAGRMAHLPEFGADLVPTLPRLDVHNLTHGGRLPDRGCEAPAVASEGGWRPAAGAVVISFDERLKGALEEEQSLGAKFGANANGKKAARGCCNMCSDYIWLCKSPICAMYVWLQEVNAIWLALYGARLLHTPSHVLYGLVTRQGAKLG